MLHIYSQVKNGVVVNIFEIDDDPAVSKFKGTFDQMVAEFSKNVDSIHRIDHIDPMPDIGWTYDGIKYANPVPPAEPEPMTVNEWRKDSASKSKQIMIDFYVSKTDAGLAPDQLNSLATTLAPLHVLLGMGDVKSVIAILPGLPTDDEILTAEDLQALTESMTAYLDASPPPASDPE